MELSIWVFFVAAVIPLFVGAIWYNPAVLGKAWMRSSGVTEEQTRSGNMLVIFGLTYLLGLFLSAMLYALVVHQSGMTSLLAAEPGFAESGTEVNAYYVDFMERYGDRHRTFGHGAFHGVFASLLLALPIIGIVSLFERRGFRYVAIHTGYWMVTLALMGGLIAQFA